jgi:hypothetical protein
MIDFAQGSGRGRGSERVDLVVLIKHGEVERQLLGEGATIDV